jgi:hypothetical protein
MSTSNGIRHETNGVVHNQGDLDVDQLYSFWPAPSPALAPCPEAAFSLTLKGQLDGVEALLTVRGQSGAEFRRNLEQVRGLLDAPASQPQPLSQDAGWCAVHHVQMQENEKDGRRWFSHFDQGAGRWCKGR